MIQKKIINERNLVLLKDEIENHFGKKISTAGDCSKLSALIFSTCACVVSANTLRRYFGLIQSPYLPSVTTVQILAKYCGYTSFEEFVRLKTADKKPEADNVYAQSVLAYLVSLFKSTTVREQDDRTFSSVVKQTLHFLQRHPELMDDFQRAVARSKTGQEYYFEQSVHIDGLNGAYGQGLRYYLNEKKTAEGQILGNALLCLKHWLSENPEGVREHFEALKLHKPTLSTHPSIAARYYASVLIYAEVYDLAVADVIEEAEAFHRQTKNLIRTDKCRFFPCFEYVMSPVLLIMGYIQQAKYYTDYSVKNYPRRNTGADAGYFQTMDLFAALTMFKAGNVKEAEIFFHNIHPSKFNPQNKKSSTILYLLLSQHLRKNNTASDQQLTALIKETGFTRLKQLIHDD